MLWAWFSLTAATAILLWHSLTPERPYTRAEALVALGRAVEKARTL